MDKMYTGAYVLIAYAVGVLSIFSGYIHSYVGLVVGLLLLLLWDIGYAVHSRAFEGRSPSDTNDSVTRARTYISWYIGIYGVVIGLVLSNRLDASSLATALEVSNTPVFILVLPLLLSIASMLFIPITVGDKNTINAALKSLFVFVVYLQKVILILIGHLALRLIAAYF